MKKSRNYLSKKFISLLIGGFILLIALSFLGKNRIRTFFQSDPSNQPKTVSQINNEPDTKINYNPSNPSDNDQINQIKNSGGAPTPQPVNDNMTATVTNTRVVNGLAQVSVLISGTSTGNCNLSLSKVGSTTVTATTAITNRNGIYTCEDFNISTTKLGAGTWGVNLVLETDTSTSKPATSTLQVSP